MPGQPQWLAHFIPGRMVPFSLIRNLMNPILSVHPPTARSVSGNVRAGYIRTKREKSGNWKATRTISIAMAVCVHVGQAVSVCILMKTG